MNKQIAIITFLIAILSPLYIISNDAINYFPEIVGWKKSAAIQTYNPKTLFAYIDGAAELYINYNFEELKVAEYRSINSKATIIAEVYRHNQPINAFGIYSQEKPDEAKFSSVGTQGYGLEGIFNFFKGSYYVKISAFDIKENESQILKDFASKISGQLGKKEPFPGLIQCFPEEGKVKNSEKYVSKNVLGYSFFHSGYLANYNDAGNKFTALIIEATDAEDGRRMMTEYMKKNDSTRKIIKEGIFTVKDSYHGNIMLQWKGNYIWGILYSKNQEVSTKYINLIEEYLIEQKKVQGKT